MKCFVIVCCALLHLTQSKVLPTYLKKYSCQKSDPEYEKCVWEGFESVRQYFVKGIPELDVPPVDPFKLPYMSVNRTINELMSISAVCKDITVSGFKNTIIDDLKADPIKHSGEIRLTIPWLYLDMDYDVRGQLLIIPLESSGHFQGNFTNTQMFVKGSLKTYTKNGVEYFKTNKLDTKITIGDGEIKLTSKTKEMQYAADLITEFFNENPRRVLDAVNPIFIEWTKDFFIEMSDEILATLPASEWLPA
nr:circadian clock-controlled protein-like [Leptinotarsa decemlineata]